MASASAPSAQTDDPPSSGSRLGVPLSGIRVPALDGIRGLAVLLVLLFHFTAIAGARPLTDVDNVILRATGAGWAGVDLFFVLSGFLITGILYDAKYGSSAAGYFGNFYVRRALRIFPLYYGFLLILFFLIPVIQSMETNINASVAADRWWYVSYLTNVRIALDPATQPSIFLTGHLWSLAVEEQFYLLWPTLVFVLNRRWLLVACALMLILAPGLRVGMWVADVDTRIGYTLTPARIDTLALGALIAVLMRDQKGLAFLLRAARPALVLSIPVIAALFVVSGNLSPYNPWVQTFGFTALALFFGAVLLSAVSPTSSGEHRIWETPPLRFFGRYSYALYLFHWPVAALLARRTELGTFVPEVYGSVLPGHVVFALTAGAISVAAAWLSWHLLESHILKLKRFFEYRRAPEPGPEPQPIPAQAVPAAVPAVAAASTATIPSTAVSAVDLHDGPAPAG